MADTATQLVDLQSRLAFQEDLLSTLDRRIADQDREIRQLTLDVAQLKETCRHLLHALQDQSPYGGDQAAPLERPPHY